MKTIAELAAFDKQRVEIDDEMDTFGRQYGAEIDKPIPANAYFEGWEYFPLTRNIILTYQETWQGGSERTVLFLTEDEYEKLEQPA